MRRKFAIFVFFCGLVCSAFYTLYGEADLPDYVLQSIRLLKKPIEDLLPDLSDALSTQAIEAASLDLQPHQELRNERERWNEMRRLIEAGQPLFMPLPSEIALSTAPLGRLAPAVPPPPGFTVQLPYESRLTVSGRKTIGMIFRSTKYSNSGYATTQGVSNTQSSFELLQSLQVRINGQIGRKVTVNVDFDDTKTDKKDISIVYKGDPDEVVQRAAFGDINMSLPQTEFAGYTKQVFGAAAELKYKALKGYFIGSRTKGQTETKEFVGNVQLQRVNIPDTSYVRRRFYNYKSLTGPDDNNVAVSTVKIYLDTQDTTRSGPQYTTTTVDLTLIPNRPVTSSTTYEGRFLLLAQGIDYFVDPSSGIVTFRTPLTNTSVVAIDYTIPGTTDLLSTSRGIVGMPKAIKWDESQITLIPATEELTHYNIGSNKIVRDNNQGNFTLQLRDLGNNFIGPAVGILYLPNNSGQIVVDFEAGSFALTRRLDNGDPASSFAPVYFFTPTTQSSFFIEYRARVKTYTLRPNIVINSERITLDGRPLVRDIDYFLDYASGFLTFFNEDQITETTRIQATYEFSPFGIAGTQQDTLVGARGEVSFAPVHPILASSLLGSTVIYDFAPKQTAAPDIRQTSGSWLILEGDIHLRDLIFNPLPTLKSSFSAEVARSVRNPNTFGKALIENMEGIKDETSVSLSKLGWQIAANPTSAGTGGQYLNAIGQVSLVNQPGDNLTNNLVRTLDINPNAAALEDDQTQVLSVRYDLTLSTEASIATVLKTGGVDFSKKQYLEMWMMGDGTAAGTTPTPSETRINITLGQISEDFDGSGDSSIKTEDANGNNTLDASEDTGIPFINPDSTVATLGANNLRIDSNDLDRNGVLNTENILIGGNIGYDADLLTDPISSITFPGEPENRVDFSGWKFVRVPLNISSSTASNWSAIKELRLSLKPGGTATKTGTIHIAKIAIVGNRWLPEDPTVVGSTISVTAINTEDDASYVSPAGDPDFDDLNQINTALTGPTPTNRKEQSLAVNYSYDIASGTVLAKNVTVSPMDFTPYGSVRFFVRKNAAKTSSGQEANLVFRAGSDTDYWEFSYPIDSLVADVWTQIKIDQTGGERPNLWVSGVPDGTVRAVGNPNLSSIAQLKFGVDTTTAATRSGELWFNEVYGADVISRVGYASSFKASLDLFGWGSLTGSARNIDRNFETFTSAITNQDRHEQTATLNLTRLSWFPMAFTGSQRHTITPAINTVNSTLVSYLQEGDVRDKSFSGSGTLQIPRLPKFGLFYDANKTVSSQIFRTDKADRYGITMDYDVPARSRFLPRNISMGYRYSRLRLNFGDGALTNASDPFSVSNTRNNTQDINAKLSFQPASGFSINPSFSRSITHEAKDVLFSTSTGINVSTQTVEYDKLKTQTLGLDGVFSFRRWFSPRMRYTITNRETFGLPLAANLLAADRKTVDRTSTAEAGWDLAWRDLTRRLRPLQSMNVVTTYLVENGDSWKEVEGGYNSLNSISVRNSLGSGTRTNLTIRETVRSTQRLSPFDWATQWTGPGRTIRTMSLTSNITDTRQRQETTGTPTKIITQVFPDLLMGFAQTEHLFLASRWMSNSQLNLKTQHKKVDTAGISLQKASTNGGDWRFTILRKLDLYTTYTRTSDSSYDRINSVTTSQTHGSVLGMQLGFNVGKWRLSPKYDQTSRETEDASGRLTADLRTKTAALQAYADLYLPAGLKLPFADLVVFSNRIRTTENFSVDMRRSKIDELNSNTDTYKISTSNDYEMTSNIRLSFGGNYFYTANKVSSDANTYGYEVNTLLTIQF